MLRKFAAAQSRWNLKNRGHTFVTLSIICVQKLFSRLGFPGTGNLLTYIKY